MLKSGTSSTTPASKAINTTQLPTYVLHNRYGNIFIEQVIYIGHIKV